MNTGSTTGHETEAINVQGLKASLKKGGNKGIFNEATCSTAAATAAKEITTAPKSFSLVAGAKILVKFANAITVANATLQVGSATAKPIYYHGAALAANLVKAGSVLLLAYDGTSFNIVGDLDTDTTYTDMVASGTNHKGGLVPDPGDTEGTTKYLREDGTWETPPDTTYESKAAASGGTDVSLVTTGDKYNWNQKADKASVTAGDYNKVTVNSEGIVTSGSNPTTLAGHGITDAYTKTEVNNLVDTPHQEYVTVATYASLPVTGSKDTIYRVSNYNGSTSQVDATSYSEYAWDGSSYIFLCVKSQIDEVFDITAYNSNTKYADISAALGVDGANVPQTLRKGGMSIRFIQISDNKYVRFNYLLSSTANADIANVSNWQGVDDEPTEGSNNLVKSNGVYQSFIDKCYQENIYTNDIEGEGFIVKTSYNNKTTGDIVSFNGYNYSYPILVHKGDIIKYTLSIGYAGLQCALYSSNTTNHNTFIKSISNNEIIVENEGYIVFSYDTSSAIEPYFAIFKWIYNDIKLLKNKTDTIFYREYYAANISGYIEKSSGDFVGGSSWEHVCTDYIYVPKNTTIYISNTVQVGYLGTECAFYDINKNFVRNLSNESVVEYEGYVRFCGLTNTVSAESFSTLYSLTYYLEHSVNILQEKAEVYDNIFSRILKLATLNQPQYNLNSIDSAGNWQSFGEGGTFSFDITGLYGVVSGDRRYAGARTKFLNNKEIKTIVMFQAKGLSGDYSNIGISRATNPLPSTNKILLSDSWKWYIMDIPTGGDNNFVSFNTYNNSSYSIGVRNFFYAEFGDFTYRILEVLRNVSEILDLKFDFIPYNDKTGSIDAENIDNVISDMFIPSWTGKIEHRNSDLFPSINNAGQAYTINNNGTLELRIVKNANEIVGCALETKKTNIITPASFSMVHYGDSVTHGVGSNPNYVERLKTLLENDGHTITSQTNNGINGVTAEGVYNSYKNASVVHSDYATYMIGINDKDRWLSDKNPNWETDGMKPADFRAWFRKYLRLSIDVILEKTTCTKLFVIVPYLSATEIRSGQPYPSKEAYYSTPLHQIIIQEYISLLRDYNNIWLCRGDYYVPSTFVYIPDGLHVNNDGAQLLAQGIRDEMTYRV